MLICDECRKEVVRVTVMFEGDERWSLCVHCAPAKKMMYMPFLNKNGYTVSPAYYDDITSRRLVPDIQSGVGRVENRVNRTYFT